MDRQTVSDKLACSHAAGPQRATQLEEFLAEPDTSCALDSLTCINKNVNKCAVLSCGHLFHEGCYAEWKKTNSNMCPRCGTTTNWPKDLIADLDSKAAPSCVVSGGKRSKRHTKRSKRHTKRHSKRRTHRQPKLGRR